jgi:hypothetical protein
VIRERLMVWLDMVVRDLDLHLSKEKKEYGYFVHLLLVNLYYRY